MCLLDIHFTDEELSSLGQPVQDNTISLEEDWGQLVNDRSSKFNVFGVAIRRLGLIISFPLHNNPMRVE